MHPLCHAPSNQPISRLCKALSTHSGLGQLPLTVSFQEASMRPARSA